MALSDVKKPRVLALVSDGNTDLSDAVSTQLFTDKLGSNAPFATLPLNANFSQVQASIDSHTGIGHEVNSNRALPDYFIRMVLPPARTYTLATNLSYKTQQSYQAWAFAELLSRDGRVLYSADVNQRIDDTVTNQSGFSVADRKEVILKNALSDLADRFSNEVRFMPVMLKVTDTSSDTTQDVPAALPRMCSCPCGTRTSLDATEARSPRRPCCRSRASRRDRLAAT
jgi:hypothetical protein